MSAADRLANALRDLLESGSRPPCSADPDAWHADSAAERTAAAQACNACPLLLTCREASEGETWGVWGGIDRTTTHPRKRKAA